MTKLRLKTELNLLVRFTITLLLSLVLGYIIHAFLVQHYWPSDAVDLPLKKTYFLNGVLAIVSYVVLNIAKGKFAESLGFIFLWLSLGKYVLFFALFKAGFDEDGVVDKLEFFAVVLPYLFALLLEVVALRKLLSSAD